MTLTDAAGNERTEEQIKAIVRRTLQDMSQSEITEIIIEGIGVTGLPDDLVRCPEHGLWYDACEDYS